MFNTFPAFEARACVRCGRFTRSPDYCDQCQPLINLAIRVNAGEISDWFGDPPAARGHTFRMTNREEPVAIYTWRNQWLAILDRAVTRGFTFGGPDAGEHNESVYWLFHPNYFRNEEAA